MTASTLDDALVIRPSARRRLPVLGLVSGLCVLWVLVALAVTPPPALLVSVGLLYGVALVLSVLAVLQARHADWDLRLDATGVTVRGHRTVPWSDLAEVRVSGLQVGRLRRLSLGQQVAALIPRPGIELATMPSMESRRFSRWSRWGSRRRIAMWGSNLALLPSMANASPGQVEAAVRRFSEVPVRHL